MTKGPIRYYLLPLLLLLSCSKGVAVIAVDLEDLPSDVVRFEIGISLEGEEKPRPSKTLGATKSFDVELPEGVSGQVLLWVDGLMQDGCRNAHVEHKLTVQGVERYPLRLRLVPDEGCILRVERIGTASGQVAIEPGGLLCEDWSQGCVHRFLGRDRSLTLSARATDPDSYFLGWTGDCHGSAPCVLRVPSGTSTVGAMFLQRTLCGDEGWCWQKPRPTGENLYRIWGASGEDLWALGDNGLILRGDGRVFAPLARQTKQVLEDIRGSSPNDVWAVGKGGTILRFRGTTWEAVESGTNQQLNSLWSFGPNHAYAVGAQGTILRWDGIRWSAKRPASGDMLSAIWGSIRKDGRVDLWMAGSGGVVIRGDGENFQVIDRHGVTLHDIWGSNLFGNEDPEVVWIVGANCTAIRYPDRLKTTNGESSCIFRSIWGSGPEDIWLAGTGNEIYRVRGNRLTLIYRNQNFTSHSGGFYSIWGSSPGDVWFAGVGGAIFHHNGIALSAFAEEEANGLHGVFALSSNNVFALGSGASLFRFLRGHWVRVELLEKGPPIFAFRDIWARSDTDLWIAGQTNAGACVLHFDGKNTVYEETTMDDGAYSKIWGSSAGDVWAGGTHGRVIHFTPGQRARYTIAGATPDWTITGIAGRSTTEVMFTGIIYKRNAQGIQIPDRNFGFFWNGNQIVNQPAPEKAALNHLFFHPATGYVAAGERYMTVDNVSRLIPTIFRYQGRPGAGTWVAETVEGTEQRINGVFGTSLADLRAVATGGVMLARGQDGIWRPLSRMASSSLNAIHGLPNGEMWTVGAGGEILHRQAKTKEGN